MPVVLTTEKNDRLQAYLVWKTSHEVKYAQCGPVGEVLRRLGHRPDETPDEILSHQPLFTGVLGDVVAGMSSEEFTDQLNLGINPPGNVTSVFQVEPFIEDPDQLTLVEVCYPRLGDILPDDIPPELYPTNYTEGNGKRRFNQFPREREKDYSQRLTWDRGHDAYTDKVKQVYDHECAVCGLKIEIPKGDPGGNYEVEAAHIQRAADGGPDKLPNRISLCRLHHWAFDNGWVTLTDDHHIIVRDAPHRSGYEEFQHLDGQKIRLPEDPDSQPHPHFLQIHRENHGFETSD